MHGVCSQIFALRRSTGSTGDWHAELIPATALAQKALDSRLKANH